MDPVKRAAMFIKMNDLLIQNVVVIPVLWRRAWRPCRNKLRNTEQSGVGIRLLEPSHLVPGGVAPPRPADPGAARAHAPAPATLSGFSSRPQGGAAHG